MNKEIWTMSNKELERMGIIKQTLNKHITQKQASRLIGVSERHFRRLIHSARQTSPQEAVISKKRGQVSNHRLPEDVKRTAITLLQTRYSDFYPTLAHEMLFQHHRKDFTHSFSVETLRQWMLEEGLYKKRSRRVPHIHPARTRRACFGEIIQIDGSPHDWFEGRSPSCTLIAFIDDATSAITAARFVSAETTFNYMQVLHDHLQQYGRPVSLYSDKHSIFRVNAKETCHEFRPTQFTRALQQLGIEPIHANSPQAKGRIERLFKTLQDRLVKLMRLEGVNDIEQANRFLAHYIPQHNQKFATAPRCLNDAHQVLSFTSRQLTLVLSKQVTRMVSTHLTCQYHNKQYQIQTNKPSYTMRKSNITLCETMMGQIVLLYKNRELPYTVYHEGQCMPKLLSAKGVNQHVNQIIHQQHPKLKQKVASNHPWKRWNPDCFSSTI